MRQCFIFILTMLSSLLTFGQSAKSDEYFAKGVEAYNSSEYRRAIECFEKCDALDKVEMDSTESRAHYAEMWLASCYYKLGDKTRAAEYQHHYYDQLPVDRRLTADVDYYSDKAQAAAAEGGFDMAIMYSKMALDKEIALLGHNHYYVGFSHSVIAEWYISKGDFSTALIELDKALLIFQSLNSETHGAIAVIHAAKSYCLFGLGSFEDAYDESTNALTLLTFNDPYKMYYLTALNVKLQACYSLGKMDEAADVDNIIKERIDNFSEDELIENSMLVFNHIDYSLSMGYGADSYDIAIRMLPLAEKTGGSQSDMYAYALARLANCQAACGDFASAKKSMEESHRIFVDVLKYDEIYYVDNLIGLANFSARLGQYDEAIGYAERARKLNAKMGQQGAYGLAVSLSRIAGYYEYKNEYSQAEKYIEDAIATFKQSGNINNIDYALSVKLRGVILSKSGKPDVASRVIADHQEATRIMEALNMKFSAEYYELRLSLANFYHYSLRQPEEAHKIADELFALCPDNTDEHKYLRAKIYLFQVQWYLNENPRKAEELCEKAYELINDVKQARPQANDMGVRKSLADCYAVNKKWNEAIKLGEELAQEAKLQYGDDSLPYADMLLSLIDYYAERLDAVKCQQYIDLVVDIYSKQLGTQNLKYANTLMRMAVLLNSNGDNKRAKAMAEEVMKIYKANNYAETYSAVGIYNLLSQIELSFGNIDKALSYANQAVEIAQRMDLSDYSNVTHAIAVQLLAQCYQAKGKFVEAMDLLEDALDIAANPNGDRTNMTCMKIFVAMSSLHQVMGNASESYRYMQLVSDIAKAYYGEQHPMYMLKQMVEANDLMGQGRYKEALDVAETMETNAQITFDKTNEYVLIAKLIKAMVYAFIDVERGIELGEDLYHQCKSINSISNELGIVTMLRDAYLWSEQYDKALKYALEVQQLAQNIYGSRSHQTAGAYSSIAAIYMNLGDMDNCYKYMNICEGLGRDIVLNNFTTMTEKERAYFWNTYINFYRGVLPSVCQISGHQERFTKLAYDGMLLSDGILLETNRQMAEMVQKSNNESLKSLFGDWMANKSYYDRVMAFNNTIEQDELFRRTAIADSIGKLLEVQERQLLTMVKDEVGDFTSSLRLQWQDVERSLSKDDLAIEFVHYSPSADSSWYAALLLKKGMKAPQFVPILSLEAGETIGDDDEIIENLSKYIWASLSEYLADVKNIYFTPIGELYNLPIESLPDWRNPELLMADTWNFYRLSSTRELALFRTENKNQNAAVYGGLKYDTSVSSLQIDAERYPEVRNRAVKYNAYVDTLGLRAKATLSIEYLPGTKREADDIMATIKASSSNSMSITDFTGERGTETSFKALSGKEHKIIHVATHGFYFDSADEESKAMIDLMSLSLANDTHRTWEDKALMRSGLYFAGAENKYQGTMIPDGLDDGILTAQEISTLDLSGLDLIALSACQTGQGDVSGDGVFGLQRGFKKAGASSILMSLWKVDDEATSLLMTQFYKNWMSGMSKHTALEEAKKMVRTNPRYSDPKYWAAFILLDGLN